MKATVSGSKAGPRRNSAPVPEEMTDREKRRIEREKTKNKNKPVKPTKQPNRGSVDRQTRFDGEIEVIPDEDDDDTDSDHGDGLTDHDRVIPTVIRELPYKAVQPLPQIPMPGPQQRFSKEKEPIPQADKQPAYRQKAPVQSDELDKKVLSKVMDAEITLTTEEVASCSPALREELKKLFSKKRVSTEKQRQTVAMMEVPDEETYPELKGMINASDLPVAGWLVSRVATETVPTGSLVVEDPIECYLESLTEGEKPKEIYVAKESHALRSLYPMINGVMEIESVSDSGSMIVSMSFEVAKALRILWDPDIRINMQSANGTIEKTVGLARNVPFLFKDITIYLQCHVIKNVAYKVLIGRPFDVLTTSTVHNSADGGQLITITDPNTGRRVTMPTYERGKPPVIMKHAAPSVFQNSMI